LLCLQGKALLFTDGRSRIDYVLVWREKSQESDRTRQNMKSRRVFEQNLKEDGLILEYDIKVWVG